MLLKKSAILVLGLLALPVVASANLETYNWTTKPSIVKIVLNPGTAKEKYGNCSATFGKITPPFNAPSNPNQPGHLSTTPLDAKAVCGQFTGACTADIFASSSCADTHPIARMSIDLSSLAVKLVRQNDQTYTIVLAGTRVDIKSK
jgi:hypothetical protein